MADNTSSKGKGRGGGGEGEGAKKIEAERNFAQTQPKNGQMNNVFSDVEKSEERKRIPPVNVFKQEATLIYDFQSATQEEIDIVAVSVLKRISIQQSHELRRKQPKVFRYWYKRFWFYTGAHMRKPPTPPSGWFLRCIQTQPSMKDGEWRPKGWWTRFLTCPLAGQQWKPICRVLPSLHDIMEKNKNVKI